METIQEFKSVEFMTKEDKVKVFKQWKSFLKGGMKRASFTKRLYEHLHLHCGFIAHYSINGFYAEYFTTANDKERFFDWLFSENNYCGTDFNDLYGAIKEIYEGYKAKIDVDGEVEIGNKIAVLKACISKAEEDPVFAKSFLSKLNM